MVYLKTRKCYKTKRHQMSIRKTPGKTPRNPNQSSIATSAFHVAQRRLRRKMPTFRWAGEDVSQLLERGIRRGISMKLLQ